MADDLLVNVNLSADSHKLIKRLEKLSPSLGEAVKTIGKNAVKGVTDLALKAYKSKVPIDTLALRGQGLNDGFIQSKVNQYEGKVFIKDGTHTNRHGKKQSSVELADIILNEDKRDLSRTRDSAAIDNYGPEPKGSAVRGWKDKAYRAFISPAKLGAYLKRTDFLRNVS